ncbi:MAG: hypothetical protein M3Z09_16790, partial [Acidobacteriota bacterium]|nr:hypothetical protein [Acidobacteriota bacterium]
MFCRVQEALLVGLSFAILLPGSPSKDNYPKIRLLIAEVENASTGIRSLPDKSIPLESVAHLYARAGYLEDAARVLKVANLPLDRMSRAQALYGDFEGALRSLVGTRDSMLKTSQTTAIAMVLWSMGEPLKAAIVLDNAEACAKTIPDPIHKKRQLQMIQQQREVLPDPPPVPV